MFRQNPYNFYKAPKAGYRAVNVAIQTESQSALFDHLSGIHHTLLIFMGQDNPASIKTLYTFAEHAKINYQAVIQPIIVASKDFVTSEQLPYVIIDSDDAIHQAYGAWQACLYLIRPDLHIAYRNQQLHLDAISKYLDRILI
jgi:hypothetical protein